jgi:hypothetical protein
VEVPVGARRIQFLPQAQHRLARGQRIGIAVQHQNARRHLARLGRRSVPNTPWKLTAAAKSAPSRASSSAACPPMQ